MSTGEGLAGSTALVVGASRGIGEAVARRLAAAGARVVVAARSQDRIRRIAEETGGRALRLDVRDPSAVEAALRALVDDLGSVPDIVVNAAGVFDIAPISETSAEMLDAALTVNLQGPFAVLRCLLPGMIERGSGTVVNVGSVAGRKAFPGNAAYSATKFGLRGFHEVLVEELRGTGVRACLIEPAATDTPLWDPLDPDADPDLPDRSQMLHPEHVAEAVHFVCSRPEGVQVPVLAIERC